MVTTASETAALSPMQQAWDWLTEMVWAEVVPLPEGGWQPTASQWLLSQLYLLSNDTYYAPPNPAIEELVTGQERAPWLGEAKATVSANRRRLLETFADAALTLVLTASPDVLTAARQYLGAMRAAVQQREGFPGPQTAPLGRGHGGLLDIIFRPRERGSIARGLKNDLEKANNLIQKAFGERQWLLYGEALRALDQLLHLAADTLATLAAEYAPLRSEVAYARRRATEQWDAAKQRAIADLEQTSDLIAPHYWFVPLVEATAAEERAATQERLLRVLDGLRATYPVQKITAERILRALRQDAYGRAIEPPSLHAAFTAINPLQPDLALRQRLDDLTLNELPKRPGLALRQRRHNDPWLRACYLVLPAGTPPFHVEGIPSLTLTFRDPSPNRARLVFTEVITNFTLEDLALYRELRAAGVKPTSRVLCGPIPGADDTGASPLRPASPPQEPPSLPAPLQPVAIPA